MKPPQGLIDLRPCSEAVDWLRKGKFKSRQVAWDSCKRGDWMLWLLGKLSGPPEGEGRKKLVLAACGCARLALKYVKEGEHRPRICIETAEAWTRGEATIEQVRDARNAAAAADVAYAAAYAACTAYAAADAAYAAAVAAADAYAYAAAADADARSEMLAKCADLVRKHYPKAPKLCVNPTVN